MKDQNKLFDEIGEAFSVSRLAAYLDRPECQDKLEALAAYYWNIQLSQALYPALQALEIALRNALYQAISQHYGSLNWFDSDFLDKKEHWAINEAKKTLSKQKKPIIADQLIAELRFGFWTSLFDVRYEHQQILWPKLLPQVFPYIPKKFRTRHYLSKQLNSIRNLRNRVFHYEPIWYRNRLLEQHQSMLDILQWISPLAHTHLLLLDQFNIVYQQEFTGNQRWLQQ